MFVHKSEDSEELPDLPGRNSYFDKKYGDFSDEEDNEKHALPSFPDSPTHNHFSQATIKEAVSENINNEKPKIVEMKEWSPADSSESELPELPEPPEMGERIIKVQKDLPSVIGVEKHISSGFQHGRDVSMPNVFVKIDKFHSARRALAEVRDKLMEIDELLKGIKEIKQKEEQELTAWEQELMQVKARIGSIAENIFEKVK